MQVEVHHVDAEVAGPHFADQRVHVGAVHVEQRALGVQDVGDLVDLLSKTPSVLGLVSISAATSSFTCASSDANVDHARCVRLQVLDLVAADRRGGGIGAVRRVGDEDLLARIALRLVIGADQQDAGELAMRAGRGLQRDGVHAGDFDQALAQQSA